MAQPDTVPVVILTLAPHMPFDGVTGQPDASESLKDTQPMLEDQAYPDKHAAVVEHGEEVDNATSYALPPAPESFELKDSQPMVDDQAQPERHVCSPFGHTVVACTGNLGPDIVMIPTATATRTMIDIDMPIFFMIIDEIFSAIFYHLRRESFRTLWTSHLWPRHETVCFL
ncbi:MAG: hypothetical protein KGL39_43465, partial [Patescibacteria group bacterium]|nr:hypothetical protein [Patescibacteria group bacterium]